MSKKLLLTSVILLASPTILFAAIPAGMAGIAKAVSSKQNVAATKQSITQENTVSQNAGAPVVSKPDRAASSFYAGLGFSMLNDKGFTGLMPKAYLGYGTYIGKCNIFYSALEILGGAGSLSLSPNQHYRVSNVIGASFIPGYMVSDWTMLFLRFGVQSAHYSHLNTTKRSSVFGAGLEIYTTQHWDTRLEYDYANNKNMNQFNVDFIYKFK